jgi:hypothetical protein
MNRRQWVAFSAGTFAVGRGSSTDAPVRTGSECRAPTDPTPPKSGCMHPGKPAGCRLGAKNFQGLAGIP